MSKERLINLAVGSAVVLMALAIPFGAAMGIYTENNNWFFLCGFLLIFLS